MPDGSCFRYSAELWASPRPVARSGRLEQHDAAPFRGVSTRRVDPRRSRWRRGASPCVAIRGAVPRVERGRVLDFDQRLPQRPAAPARPGRGRRCAACPGTRGRLLPAKSVHAIGTSQAGSPTPLQPKSMTAESRPSVTSRFVAATSPWNHFGRPSNSAANARFPDRGGRVTVDAVTRRVHQRARLRVPIGVNGQPRP